jgi:hypothetical protein
MAQDDPRSAGPMLLHAHMKVRLDGDKQDTVIAATQLYSHRSAYNQCEYQFALSDRRRLPGR